MWRVIGIAAASMLLAAGVAADEAKQPTGGQTEQQTEMEQQAGQEQQVELSAVHGEKAREIQQKLKEQGFYQGKVDGILGTQSKNALKEFQKSQGFEASGKLDQQTASALGIEFSDIQPVRGTEEPQPPPEEQPMEQPMEQPVEETEPQSGSQPLDPEMEQQKGQMEQQWSPEQIRQVQQQLKDQGHYTGEVTGQLDEETKNAIRKFQRAQGLPETGNIDANTAQQLGIQMPEPGVVPQSGEELPEDAQDVEPQSGIEGEATSPVTGGETETTETEPTSGETLGGEPAMGGVETQEDPNVVEEGDIEQQAGAMYEPETIRQVQQKLKDEGIFDGEVTGQIDRQTTEAIRNFQRTNGLTVTGQLDQETLDALGVEAKMKPDHMHQPGQMEQPQ